MHVHYDPTYCQTDVAYDTTRKADAIAQSLHDRPIAGAQLISPDPATRLLTQLAACVPPLASQSATVWL